MARRLRRGTAVRRAWFELLLLGVLSACTEVGRSVPTTNSPIRRSASPDASSPAMMMEPAPPLDAGTAQAIDAGSEDAHEVQDSGIVSHPPTGPDGIPCTIQIMLANRCQSCHGATPSNGAPNALMTYDDLRRPSSADPSQPEAQRALLRIQATSNQMPPDPLPRASSQEIYALAQWILSGYPYESDCTFGQDAGVEMPAPDASWSPLPDAGVEPAMDAGTVPDAGMSPGVDAGSTTSYCQPCTTDQDCNPGTMGNLCLDDGNGGGACGSSCITDADCPTGAACYEITDQNNQFLGDNCFPTSNTCSP